MGKEEENENQEDFDKYEGKVEEEPATEIEVTIEIVRKEEEKEPVIKERWNQPTVHEVNVIVVDTAGDEISGGVVKEEGAPGLEVKNIEVHLCQPTKMEEDEELVRVTRGLAEKFRDEGITYTREKDKQSLEKLPGDAEVGDQKVNRNDYGNILKEKPQRVTDREAEESTNNKILNESSKRKETGHVKNEEAMPEEMKPGQPVGGLLEKRDVDNGLKAERSGVEMVGTGNTTEEELKPKGKKPAVLQGGRANNVHHYQLERKKKEIVISTNADAREIADESGFNLYDSKHEHAASQHDVVVEGM